MKEKIAALLQAASQLLDDPAVAKQRSTPNIPSITITSAGQVLLLCEDGQVLCFAYDKDEVQAILGSEN